MKAFCKTLASNWSCLLVGREFRCSSVYDYLQTPNTPSPDSGNLSIQGVKDKSCVRMQDGAPAYPTPMRFSSKWPVSSQMHLSRMCSSQRPGLAKFCRRFWNSYRNLQARHFRGAPFLLANCAEHKLLQMYPWACFLEIKKYSSFFEALCSLICPKCWPSRS